MHEACLHASVTLQQIMRMLKLAIRPRPQATQSFSRANQQQTSSSCPFKSIKAVSVPGHDLHEQVQTLLCPCIAGRLVRCCQICKNRSRRLVYLCMAGRLVGCCQLCKNRSRLLMPLHCRTLGKVLPDLLAAVKPDLVLYDAGVDPHQNDALGRLSLTSDGLFRRDMQVETSTCSSPLHSSYSAIQIAPA